MINLFYVFAIAALILIISRAAQMLSLRNRFVQKYIPVLKALELILWTLLIFYSLQVLFATTPYYPYILFTSVVLYISLLFWFYLKDILAGYLFRIRHNPAKGQTLHYDTVQGTVKEIGLSQLIIETTGGHLKRIPYSSIVTQTLSLLAPHPVSGGETVLRFQINSVHDFGQIERATREMLALSSWCIASKPITIEPDADSQDVVKISFSLINKVYLPLAQERLTKLISGFQRDA